ncbi:hypothetical protein A2U01_0094617, partial [Trifolium medium]|nr:hypothetical protein [Trifolium medium]
NDSSAGYERTPKTGDSQEQEGSAISKPLPSICLPSHVLQTMKDMAPEDALKKLLASMGTFETTAADQEKALQLEQEDNE